MSAAKSVRLKVRNSDPEVFHDVTPETWEKMQQKEANRAFYRVVTAPAIPKEVADKSATHKKLADTKQSASDKHESTTNSARLPNENAGKVE